MRQMSHLLAWKSPSKGLRRFTAGLDMRIVFLVVSAMGEIHTIITGVFVGIVLATIFLLSCRKMADIHEWSVLPWWAYCGFLFPLLYITSRLYLAI